MRSATKPVIIIFSLLTAAAAGIGIRQSAATEVAAPPVALIGATPVSMQELTERTAAHLADQQRSYEKSLKQAERTHERDQHAYREQELQALIDERVLALEAKARKTTVAALSGAVQAARLPLRMPRRSMKRTRPRSISRSSRSSR